MEMILYYHDGMVKSVGSTDCSTSDAPETWTSRVRADLPRGYDPVGKDAQTVRAVERALVQLGGDAVLYEDAPPGTDESLERGVLAMVLDYAHARPVRMFWLPVASHVDHVDVYVEEVEGAVRRIRTEVGGVEGYTDCELREALLEALSSEVEAVLRDPAWYLESRDIGATFDLELRRAAWRSVEVGSRSAVLADEARVDEDLQLGRRGGWVDLDDDLRGALERETDECVGIGGRAGSSRRPDGGPLYPYERAVEAEDLRGEARRYAAIEDVCAAARARWLAARGERGGEPRERGDEGGGEG